LDFQEVANLREQPDFRGIGRRWRRFLGLGDPVVSLHHDEETEADDDEIEQCIKKIADRYSVRLDPAEMDEETRSRSAEGIIAYSAICTHAGCSVTGWLNSETGDKDVLKCFCHNSEFNPREGAQVVFGPAPRRLPALPLAIADGSLTIAATFVGKVGAQQPG